MVRDSSFSSFLYRRQSETIAGYRRTQGIRSTSVLLVILYCSSNAASLTSPANLLVDVATLYVRSRSGNKLCREGRIGHTQGGQTHVKTRTIGTSPGGISDSDGLVFSTPSIEAPAVLILPPRNSRYSRLGYGRIDDVGAVFNPLPPITDAVDLYYTQACVITIYFSVQAL